jgi:O-antigen ligase
MLGHTAFLGLIYSPDGLYEPAFLIAGFSLGRALDNGDARRAARLLLAAGTILALWGVVQLAFGQRGTSLFHTPAALAAVINIGLAFISVLILLGVGQVRLEWLAALLFAGLCATLSRGGAIALVAGLMITWAVLRFERLEKRRLAKLIASYFIGGLGALALLLMSGEFRDSVVSVMTPPSPDEGSSVRTRMELYRLAWSAIDAPLCCGIGYLGFRWIMERGRALVPSYGEQGYTQFVHNDYLQALLELGMPGLVSLVAMAVLPLVVAARRMGASSQDKAVVFAIVAALTTMAVHAIVDFPFHVPVALLLFGLLVGRLDRLCALPGELAPRWRSPVGRIAMIIFGAGLMTILARPVVSAAASTYGTYHWRAGGGPDAAFGLELARRFDSRDWRFHFQAGQFWFAQAAQTGQPDAAQRAEAAFAAAVDANPLEPSARLAQVATHLRFASLLRAPADRALLRTWVDEALALAPQSPGIRRQHAELIRAIDARQ